MNGIDEAHVNPQILDALRAVGIKLVTESGAHSMAMSHAVATETGGMAMHNAVAAQRQMQMLSAASVTATCAKMLGAKAFVTPTPAPPPAPIVPVDSLINPFRTAPRVPTNDLLFPTAPPQHETSGPSIAELASLTITGLTLSPPFSPNITAYTAIPPASGIVVPAANPPAAITVSATPADPRATMTISINGGIAVAFKAGNVTPISDAQSTVVITVTGFDGTNKSYVINIQGIPG